MKINTITINGNTFEISDPAVEPLETTVAQLQEEMDSVSTDVQTAQQDITQLADVQNNCVLSVEQTLTKEQQAQVLNNLDLVPRFIIEGFITDQDEIAVERVDFDELIAAYEAGAYITLRLTGRYGNHFYEFALVDILEYPLEDSVDRSAVFLGFDTDETAQRTGIRTLVISGDGSDPYIECYAEHTDDTFSMPGYAADAYAVGEKLGDIETALDHIIDIQKRLMGEQITFTISGNIRTAIYGMTWSEWCHSQYNTFGEYVGEDGNVYTYEGEPVALTDGEVQTGEMVIADGAQYLAL